MPELIPISFGGGGGGGPITPDDITGATTVGKAVLTGDQAAARTAIGAGTSSLALGTSSSTAKAGDYQPTAANISDASTVGKNVLTAVDAAAARTAIGAGTSSLAIGTTGSTAKAGDYQPTAANISDSTSVGRSVLTSASQAAARTALSVPAVAEVGMLAENETVAGTWTFTATPVVPTPTANGNPTTKAYVDTGLAARPTSSNVKTITYGTTLPGSGTEGDVFIVHQAP